MGTDAPTKTADPTPPANVSDVVFGGRDDEAALATPSNVRIMLTRLARLVLDKQIDPKRANSTAYVVSLAAGQNDREIAAQAIAQARALLLRKEQRHMGMLSAVDAEQVSV